MRFVVCALLCTAWGCASAQVPGEADTQRYAAPPASILTADEVSTRIGTLRFFDGLPDASTVDAVYEQLDFGRAVQAYLHTIAGASTMAMRDGMDQAGMLPNYAILVTESLLDAKSLLLTGDSETVYALAWISLKGGPMVVETPPRAPGFLADAWQRPLAETGKRGPDRGRGGRYVVVPPAYAGYVPRNPYAVESPTYGVWAVFRGTLSKGSPRRAVEGFKKHLKIYPLKESARPPPNMFVDVSGKAFSTIPPADGSHFDRIHELLEEEPNEALDPEVLGILASIGIQKDVRFDPDPRRRALLAEAAAVGHATARASLFSPRDDEARLYDDRQWQRVLLGGSTAFLKGGRRLVDARARFHTYAAGPSALTEAEDDEAIASAAAIFRDSGGRPLDGARTYTLTLPAHVPAAYFWSLTLYDNQTRSMLQTDQRFPSILSGQRGLRRSEDGSITIRLGPVAPRDRRARTNWIQTVPGKGWSAVLRLYGPQSGWVEQAWRPGDVELAAEVAPKKPSRKPPKMRTAVPASVTIPDRVDTRIGTLRFVDGFPTDDTVERVYENLDFIRGVETFLSMLPGASLVAMRRGLREVGVNENGVVGIFDGLMDAHSLFLTPNTESVYAVTWLDLREGATIVRSPPDGLGIVDDFLFRYVADLGRAGPDEGSGGLYLFVPPEYQGQISELYHNYVSKTFGNIFLWRGFTKRGDPAGTAAEIRSTLEIEPLEFEIGDEEIDVEAEAAAEAVADREPEDDPSVGTRFVSLSGKSVNTIHSNDFGFYEEVDELVQEELAAALGPELLGLLSSIGIEKGTPFEPDARMRAILSDSAAVANAAARALAFRPRDRSAYLHDGSAWYTPFLGNSYRFERTGVRLVDARAMFFYLATMTTPAMTATKVGVGSQYALAATDARGRYLDGAERYRLTLPPNVPAKDFWSVVVYDPQTRSMLQAPRTARPSLSSQTGAVRSALDGSTTLYFGPEPPAGDESNWIQTVPGKGWFVILRLYGPLAPWFDGSWRPGEILSAK